MMTTSVIIVGGAGLVCAAALAVAAKAFAVYVDPKVEQAIEILPGANCGGCGYAGCADYAKAVVAGRATPVYCAPGGPDVLEELAKLLGVEAGAVERKVALVLCRGDADRAPRRFRYNGIADCGAAAAVDGGDKACSYGCLGYGSCARACPVGAIEITDKNLAVVHPDICIGCGACVKTCPRSLIKMVPEGRTIHVMCSSHDRGPKVKKACTVGCIGCGICAKTVEGDEIKLDKFLAVVDYEKALSNEEIIEKCPTKCIVNIDLTAKAAAGGDA